MNELNETPGNEDGQIEHQRAAAESAASRLPGQGEEAEECEEACIKSAFVAKDAALCALTRLSLHRARTVEDAAERDTFDLVAFEIANAVDALDDILIELGMSPHEGDRP